MIKTISVSLLFSILVINTLCSQTTSFGDEPVKWTSNKAPQKMPVENIFSGSDLVILDEKTEFHFYSKENEKIVRHLLIKINTEKGVELLSSYKLPESFDNAYDNNYYKQGRKSKIKIPFITEYHVSKFAVRKFAANAWLPVSFKLKFDKLRWIKYDGEFINDEITIFQLQDLKAGDVIELHYESAFHSTYGSNLFYFHSPYPKINCRYDFIYKVDKRFAGYSFILPVNIKDSMVHRSGAEYKDYIVYRDEIKLTNLDKINYPANSFESQTLPHVFADFRFYRILSGSYPNGAERIYEYDLFRPKNFEWIVYSDTTNSYTKIYDKQFTALRKFTNSLPASDSTNLTFFKALCDTFNNFRYISSNHLFYNESALYELYSAEHILKRRLVEHSMWKLYSDILNDKKIFYYVANVEDKRYGEHNMFYRAHYAYENNLVAVPYKKSYMYFMPRYGGLKYHLNELPFYYEGSLAALTARNFQDNMNDKDKKSFKLLKTHKGTFNENTRTENSTVKIVMDSLKARFIIKESLSGQFSTLLRHLYLNEYIDSTVAPQYFKKCLDKPLSSEHKVKLSSFITEFPFRYTFNCSEKISLTNSKKLDLKNWFSFPINKIIIPETPTHDYFFDFDFSDSYNFLLDFNTPVQVKNKEEFIKGINNNYFELESDIIKNTESSYLLKVKLVVKQNKIPLSEINLLTTLINDLESLNNFSLLIN